MIKEKNSITAGVIQNCDKSVLLILVNIGTEEEWEKKHCKHGNIKCGSFWSHNTAHCIITTHYFTVIKKVQKRLHLNIKAQHCYL